MSVARIDVTELGTRISAKTVGEGSSFFGLRVGTVRQRRELIPKAQFWCRSPDRRSAP